MRKITAIILACTTLCAAADASTAVSAVPTDTDNEILVNAEADSAFLLGEVTVTAIKQRDDLTLHPVASTVVRRPQLERLGIVSIKGVSEIAPNFYMPDYGSRMTSSIYVRGLGARMDNAAVGLTVDNVPFLNKDMYDFDISDIDRIEVLRGAQSTLYGRNTMAGQVNIYTMSPLTWQGTRVGVTAGKNELWKVSLGHYALLSQTLGMSLSADFNYLGGYWKNSYNGSRADREKGGSLRWKTSWRPNDRLHIDNTAWLSFNRNNGYPYEYQTTGEINYNDTCFYRRNSFADGLTVKYDFDNWSLSSITAVQYLDDNMTLDQDFTPLKYFTLTQKRHEWSLSQDIIARGSSGNYRWLTGVFAFWRRSVMGAPVTFKQDGIQRLILDNANAHMGKMELQWRDPEFILGSDFTLPTHGGALYHESSLDLGRWELSLGARLDYERASIDWHSFTSTGFSIVNNMNPARPIVVTSQDVTIDKQNRLRRTFTQIIPKATVSYTLPTATASDVYVSIGKGYKAGGYNTQMFSDILQQELMSQMGVGAAYDSDDVISYKPEKSWNYEAGAHIMCADGKVLTDIALFFINCTDQQVTTFPNGSTTGRITTNAGRTHSYGLETQIRYTPTDRWLFNLSYGYTNAKFKEFNDGLADYSGNRVPNAPSHTLFGGITYSIPVNGLIDEIIVNGNVRGIGSIYWDEANSSRQPFYAVAGASVALRYKRAILEIWGKNLTDTRYTVFSFKSIGNSFGQRGEPFNFGATLRMSF